MLIYSFIKYYKGYFFGLLVACGVLGCKAPQTRRVQRMPTILSESSGMLTYNGKTVWAHNDSGGEPMLYEVAVSSGKVLRTITVLDAVNRDWEDITKDAEGRAYIGDFGNNGCKRKNLCIYKLPRLDTVQSLAIPAKKIHFSYPDQHAFPPDKAHRNFDCEAFVAVGNYLYLFSKNHSQPYNGYTKCYRLPNKPGTYTAELLDSTRTGNSKFSSWVTSAAVSPSGTQLALLSSDRVWLFSDFEGDAFFRGKRKLIRLPSLSQKEAICFIDEKTLWINDEKTVKLMGGNIYRLKMR